MIFKRVCNELSRATAKWQQTTRARLSHRLQVNYSACTHCSLRAVYMFSWCTLLLWCRCCSTCLLAFCSKLCVKFTPRLMFCRNRHVRSCSRSLVNAAFNQVRISRISVFGGRSFVYRVCVNQTDSSCDMLQCMLSYAACNSLTAVCSVCRLQ